MVEVDLVHYTEKKALARLGGASLTKAARPTASMALPPFAPNACV
jgi:hypothetical protein